MESVGSLELYSAAHVIFQECISVRVYKLIYIKNACCTHLYRWGKLSHWLQSRSMCVSGSVRVVVKTYCIQYKEQASFVLVDVRTVNRASSDVFCPRREKGCSKRF